MIRLFSVRVALSISHASAENYLEGMVSINVNMTREETCIASQHGVGDGYHGRGRASRNYSTPTP